MSRGVYSPPWRRDPVARHAYGLIILGALCVVFLALMAAGVGFLAVAITGA